MKSVLISIQPKWCELIASGKKIVEVRKTKPKIDVPFKCYIYCTHNNRKYAQHIYINSGYGRKTFGVIGNWRSGKDVVDVNSHLPSYRYNAYLAEGKVIGEFVCNQFTYIEAGYDTNGNKHLYNTAFIEHRMCIPDHELHEYLYKSRENCGGWAWHISDLVIYDKPKELSDFIIPSKIGCCNEGNCRGCRWFDRGNGFNVEDDCNAPFCTDEYKPLRKAPQSWCYVEEVRNG